MSINSPDVEIVKDKETEHVDVGRNSSIRSKILTLSSRGKFFFLPWKLSWPFLVS
jgi:hypothetical protein